MPGDCPTASSGHPFSPRPKPAKAVFIRDFGAGATAEEPENADFLDVFLGFA